MISACRRIRVYHRRVNDQRAESLEDLAAKVGVFEEFVMRECRLMRIAPSEFATLLMRMSLQIERDGRLAQFRSFTVESAYMAIVATLIDIVDPMARAQAAMRIFGRLGRYVLDRCMVLA